MVEGIPLASRLREGEPACFRDAGEDGTAKPEVGAYPLRQHRAHTE